MRVLLIYPTLDCPVGISHGLAAMAGVLRSRGHQVELLHVCEELAEVPTLAGMVERVGQSSADLVGFSVLSQQWPWVEQCAWALREAYPELLMAAGGVHCTMVPEEVSATGLFQWTFVGESEWTFAELVDRLERGEDTATVPGTHLAPTPEGEAGPTNPVAPFPDLQALPPKAYDLFDMERILEVRDGWLSVLTSRGCPYRCSYCFNHQIVERYRQEGALHRPREYLRRYPPERVVEEISQIRERYPGISTVILDDDLFTMDREYVLTFCQLYREQGPGLPFVANAHVHRFDAEIAEALAAAGCRICKFGLESGSPRVRREVLRRQMTNTQIEAAFAHAHRAGLHTSAFVMFGLPREGRSEIQETIELCARLQVGRVRWALFYPFPGTEAHGMAEEDGLIDQDLLAQRGNYFDGSCLRFGDEHDLHLEKLARLFPVWINAASDWPAAARYRELVRHVEALDRDGWQQEEEQLVAQERQLSDELLADPGELHYSIRYSRVMGVRSDYVLQEG